MSKANNEAPKPYTIKADGRIECRIHILNEAQLEDFCQILRDKINDPQSRSVDWTSIQRPGGAVVSLRIDMPDSVIGIIMDIDNFDAHSLTGFVSDEALALLAMAERKLSALRYSKTQAERAAALAEYSGGLEALFNARDLINEAWERRDDKLPCACDIACAYAFQLPLLEASNAG